MESRGPERSAPPVVEPRELPDRVAREHAVDPRRNVVLEASAGTGKTRVLVDRYVNLLRAGVDPGSILAITFTRKAAAEMRQRIVDRLREAAGRSPADAARWRDLRDRLGEISISTIDAFCLSLLREFPLEADLDPGFTLADESEVPRLVAASLDRTIRICRAMARNDRDVALVFAQLAERRLRAGLATLIGRRLVATSALDRFLTTGPRDLTPETACARGAARIRDALVSVAGGLEPFLADGPVRVLSYQLVAADIRELCRPDADTVGLEGSAIRAAVDRILEYFVTKDGGIRKRIAPAYHKADAASPEAWQRHGDALTKIAPLVADAIRALHRDLNVVLSRGVWRIFNVALDQYRRTLEARAALDFSELLLRARDLLAQMDEFARSRYRLEARFQHVLVDEFQDTSRAQWDLVSQLIRSWGEGFGLAYEARLPPSIFIVGDRKQSIYGFRDAEVEVLREAVGFIAGLRPEAEEPHAISHSFRSVPALLTFVNDLCDGIVKVQGRPDAFAYTVSDEFPIAIDDPFQTDDDALGIIAGETPEACAASVADEVERLVARGLVRDRQTGVRRPVRPADIAVLFRSRESHRAFEDALEARNIPAYVYKGLGFFDADEIKDLIALMRYLADPASNLRASALLRSRFIQMSDEALRLLAPHLAAAVGSETPPPIMRSLPADDQALLALARQSVRKWLALADRIPPADLLDLVLAESAYAAETRGPRLLQARENIKKMRSLVRRIQNHGYATLARIADHLDRLSAGDESNAVVDAVDAVNLMTIHAAKGLEFPIVFVVNLARGTGGPRAPIRIATQGNGEPCVSIGDYLSAADEDTKARDLEETKRLVYVAVTRARDRLYLASVLKDGRFRPAPGSLAEVLPASLGDLFAVAGRLPKSSGQSAFALGASARPRRSSKSGVGWPVDSGQKAMGETPTIEWTGRTRSHTFRVCSVFDDSAISIPDPRSPSAENAPTGAFSDHLAVASTPRRTVRAVGTPAEGRSAKCKAEPLPAPDAFGPLVDDSCVPRVGVVQLVALIGQDADNERLVSQPAGELKFAPTPPDPRSPSTESRSENALIGAIVHELLQRWPAPPEHDERLRRAGRDALAHAADQTEADRLIDRAAQIYRHLVERPDIRTLLDAGDRLHEVPFSVRLDEADLRALGMAAGHAPVVARGSIDCLVIHPDGRVTVVEFKTGDPRPADRLQLDVYKKAARALFPDATVDDTLVYVGSV